MQQQNNVKAEYPETFNFSDGASVVFLGKLVRQDVKTKYGNRTVVECIERVTKVRFSVWWPQGMPIPSLDFPFVLTKLDRKNWNLLTCETREEAVDLWKNGPSKILKTSPGISTASAVPAVNHADFQ